MLKRLGAIAILALAACSAQPAPSKDATIDNAPRVKTPSGIVEGVAADGVKSFYGIKYATAARWKLPVATPAWKGVRRADTMGSACPQAGQETMTEDCLFLNVFAPENATSKDKLPVVVWIHGGGFRAGRGGEGPKPWVKEGVVVVTFNYRLGVLGFHDWPGWSEEDPRNFGQADMVAALEWVQHHIAAFGGDPSNVTLGGNSAGGMGVQLMMLDERARGKFARAISDAGYGAWPFPHALNPTDEMRQRMRYGALETQASLEDLVARTPYFHLPYIGGSDLKGQPADLFDAGEQASVPYIAGFNSFDGRSTMSGAGFEPAQFIALFKDEARLRTLYADDFAEGELEGATRAFGDRRYGVSARRTARAMAALGEPAYLYYVKATLDGDSEADHGAHYDLLLGNEPGALTAYMVAFAKTGAPQPEDLPKWPMLGEDNGGWMVFGPQPSVQENVIPARLDFLETEPLSNRAN